MLGSFGGFLFGVTPPPFAPPLVSAPSFSKQCFEQNHQKANSSMIINVDSYTARETTTEKLNIVKSIVSCQSVGVVAMKQIGDWMPQKKP